MREYYEKVNAYQEDVASAFARNDDGHKRHVECRVAYAEGEEVIYVYLFEDGVHIQTQSVSIPEAWKRRWPNAATVRRRVHRLATIGNVRITTLDA